MQPFIVIIPARQASTRLPGKMLADLAGVPMVVRVAQRAAASGASSVLIATDDEKIAAAARSFGFRAIMTRTDHPSGTDRLAEAVEILAAMLHPQVVPWLLARWSDVLRPAP